MSPPHFTGSPLPFEDLEVFWSGLSRLRDDRWLLQHDAGSEGGGPSQGRQRLLQRAQREALAGPPSAWHLQERRQGENSGKKKEALTSIAGGLQAVSREKGGFGFRFGRKRWTDWKNVRQNQMEGAE